MKQYFDVKGMTCSACSAHVEKAVAAVNGVKTVSVSLLNNSMTVSFDENQTDIYHIISAVEKGGYSASLKGEKGKVSEVDPLTSMKNRFFSSLIFLIPLFYLSMGHMMGLPIPSFLEVAENHLVFALLQFLLTIPVLFINRSYFINGFKSLKNASPNMDSLIALGSSAATVYSVYILFSMAYFSGRGNLAEVHSLFMDLYFESAAMILTLITLGKFLEARSKNRTTDAIRHLIDLSPDTATLLKDGVEITIPATDIKPGDILVVRAGEKIPADGVITEGHCEVDESAITGESLPILKTANDKVTAATVSKSGYFLMKAELVGSDTAFSKIIQLVEEASSSKAPIARLADKVSGIFVPVVISLSILTLIVWLILDAPFSLALSSAIAVLVVSCPCALGLATPTAIMVGTGKGAENGILIRSAETLETVSKAKTVVLDKTGTVTNGVPIPTEIVPFGCDEEFLLKIAASLEAPSEHILGRSIVNYAKEKSIELISVADFSAEPGKGVKALIEGKTALSGNAGMLRSYNIEIPSIETAKKAAQSGKTPLFFSYDNKYIGFIALADTERESSKEAISEWNKMGVEVILLTGDNRKTAEAIVNRVGIDHVISDVLPSDKEKEIRRLQNEGKTVVMIGDGINDAPALARADIGISIGSGTDVAMEASDIILIRNDLLDAVGAMKLSKAVIRNIKQNLFWAFFYNMLGIPLAAGVFFTSFGIRLSPMFAAAAMSLSSVFVVTNALRLKFFKYNKTPKDQKEEAEMKKTMIIEGMSCHHCSGRVETVLNALSGVKAEVDLASKTAHITLSKEVSDEVLKKTVEDAGYTVTDIK